MSSREIDVRIGPAGCTDPVAGARQEWLLTDGLGGYAMGTASGLRTRRYHGLLVVATEHGVPLAAASGVAERHLALAALDPVLVVGGRRFRLATDEWAGGAIDPDGARWLAGMGAGGTVRHHWSLGDVVVERELAMHRGRPAIGVRHRILRAPGPMLLELEALGTWRNVHSDVHAGWGPDPRVDLDPDGARVERVWRVQGPGFVPDGQWYRGVRYREEAARGLTDVEDLWHLGTFSAQLAAGDSLDVLAWAGDLESAPPPVAQLIHEARQRLSGLLVTAGLAGTDDTVRDAAVRALVHAADQHITQAPAVVAGYPWFGEWSRDTLTSYEGLFLSTGRTGEGAALLRRYAGTLSQGMLANTADAGSPEYNTADATLWFVHALGRHVAVTGELDLAADLLPALREILAAHLAGTRFGIGVDAFDALLHCGVAGDAGLDDHVALTWMDARVSGIAVTPRHGKPVEVNALWVNALGVLQHLYPRLGVPAEEIDHVRSLRERARASFVARFVRDDGGLRDVVDVPGPAGIPTDDERVRPNQLLAVSLPYGPLHDDPAAAAAVVRAVASLVTPLGLRTLDPSDAGYRGAHRGGPAQRDFAYHQGTVWPWLIGPYADAARIAGAAVDGLLDGLIGHLAEAGLGSVSETADGDAPHGVTGCPFQAWSVAELLRLLKPASGSPLGLAGVTSG